MLVYLIENTINSKKYVGQTSCTAEKRWQEHINNARCVREGRRQYPLYLAIRKYGPDAFRVLVLDTAETQEELNQKEIQYIQQYKTTEKEFGYNRHEGGNKPPLSTPESRRKAGLAIRGRKFTPEHCAAISKALTGKKYPNRLVSEETIQRLIQVNKARKGHKSRTGHTNSPEHCAKISASNMGRKISKESIEKTLLTKFLKTVAWG